MRRLAVLALLLPLTACDLLLDDPADGAPVYVGTDAGAIVRLAVGEEESTPLWSSPIEESAAVVVLARGEDVYASSGDEVLALDAGTGDPVWPERRRLGDTITNLAGPVDGLLFALTFNHLFAVESGNGEIAWQKDLSFELTDVSDGALAAEDGMVVLGGNPIRRLDPANGDVLASYPSGDSNIRQLRIAGGQAVAGLADGLVSLSLPGLAESWFVATPDQVDNVAIDGDTVAYSILGGGIAAVDAGAAAAAGAAEDGEIFQHVATSEGLILGVRADGALSAWDVGPFASCTLAASCEADWVVDAANATVHALAVSDPDVFLANGAVLDRIGLADGSDLGSWQTEGAVVAIDVP